ncbi:hypothetical protein CEXT_78801 [Caerostris extrusa]|uniref:Uncharacterized protein n=1 Tax=Caerostris extrusa TaxID=172846 RepID=A0AAV4N6A6_CAEEX|nr:hypothetical protein CEXT_78801 [Caerostris extrusa]
MLRFPVTAAKRHEMGDLSWQSSSAFLTHPWQEKVQMELLVRAESTRIHHCREKSHETRRLCMLRFPVTAAKRLEMGDLSWQSDSVFLARPWQEKVQMELLVRAEPTRIHHLEKRA